MASVRNNSVNVSDFDQSNVLTTKNTNNYDHEGAMKFIIVTLLVYSFIGVFSIVLTRSRICRRKRTHHRDEELAIFLKSEKVFRTEAHRQTLKSRCKCMKIIVKTYEENERKNMQRAAN